MGLKKCAIRIDSGDITYLTKKARKMLDEEGLVDCKITISNSLDEYIIKELIGQGANIDAFGIGERLITARSESVFGGVYKLAGIEDEKGNIVPKIKVSENIEKITNPGFKKVYRLYSKESGKAEADVICLHDEIIDDSKPYELFDPDYTWKRKTLENYSAKELLVQIFKDGKQVYKFPPLSDVKENCKKEIDSMWDEVLRFENPHNYYVDLSQKLWDLKHKLIDEHIKK